MGNYVYPQMVAGTGSLAAATGSRYMSVNGTSDVSWSTNIATAQAYLTEACVFSAFEVTLGTAPGTGFNRQFFLNVNGVDTALTVTISDTATVAADTTHSIACNPGDLVCIRQVASNALVAASTPNKIRMKRTGVNQQMMGSSQANVATTANRFFGVQSTGGVASSNTAATQYMAESGVLKNFYVANNSSALTTGSYLVDLYKNGVAVGLNGGSGFTIDSTAGTNAQIDASTSVSYVAGDTFWWQVVPSTPTAPNAGKIIIACCSNIPATAGHFVLINSNNGALGTSGDRWNNWHGDGAWDSTAETNVQAIAYAFTKLGYYFVLSSDTGAGKTRVIHFRVNNANADTVTFNNTGTIKTDSTSVTINDGDLLDMYETTATANASTGKYTIIGLAPQSTSPVLLVGDSNATTSAHTTSLITPSANYLVEAYVASNHGASGTKIPTSITGCGLTWVNVANGSNILGGQNVSIWRALGSSPTSGALTINWDANVTYAGWIVAQYSPVETSGSNGSGAVSQSATGTVLTNTNTVGVLFSNGFTSQANGTAAFVRVSVNEAMSAGTGMTILSQKSNATATQTIALAYSSGNVQAPGFSWTTNSSNVAMAANEINNAYHPDFFQMM